MLNLFRRHIAGCAQHGRRTGAKCSSRPPCPIHHEGIDGQGKRIKPQALIDPRTGNGVRDWARANELVRDLEAPAPLIVPEKRTTIAEAIEHFLKLKQGKSADTYRKNARVLAEFKAFTEARRYSFVTEVRFPDLTDFCSTWKGANRSKIRDLGILAAFFKFCNQCDFAPKNIGAGLFKAMGWRDNQGPREPFEPAELERLWQVLPNFPDEYGRMGQPIAKQVEAFVLLMRYAGLDVSTCMTLPKSHVRENKILTHRLKNGSEVWTVVPEWVIQKLTTAPHDSERYFFWSGEGRPHTRASKWFSRLRKLLDLAGLPHRAPHALRHTFAVEHLLRGTPIEDVSRLLGHNNISVTVRSYATWVRQRQERLQAHQERVWASDPLHQRMTSKQPAEVVQ